MAIRERLNHVAAGIADSFISRNNDLHGYWSPGLMYRELPGPSFDVELDLREGSAIPDGHDCGQVARTYAEFMRRALVKQGLQPSALTHASLHVQFNAAITLGNDYHYLRGEPFTVRVRLVIGDREGSTVRKGRCSPCDARLFTCSARPVATPEPPSSCSSL